MSLKDLMRDLLEDDNGDIKVDRHRVNDVKLLKTTLNDPHIKRIVQHVTGGDASKLKKLEATIAKREKEIECVANVSPILYEAAVDNLVETVLFDMFQEEEEKVISLSPDPADPTKHVPVQTVNVKPKEAPDVTTAPTFDPIIFRKLISKIKAESRSFFPLRNMIDFRVIHHPEIKLIGVKGDGRNEKDERRFQSVRTAAATADGTFIFYVPFMQALLDFAHLKGGLVPANNYGKKYVSRGGEIPDEYIYLEFLVRHEFMHYTYSDFYYEKIIIDAHPKIINWVGDFRSNHSLVHKGFPQLPMGLFSSYVNFHKQSSYQEMYTLVKNEFAKLKDQCKSELEKFLDGLIDHHGEQGSGTDGKPHKPDRPLKPEDIDKWNQKAKERSDKDDDDSPPPDYDNKPPAERDPGLAKGGRHEIDYKSVSPKYKWDALLRKMIGETAYVMDQTYQKISRRAIGTMQQVITRGRGAVKLGDIKNPSKKKIKLAIIIDSSGSMSYVIHKVMSNIDNLLMKRGAATGVHDEFFLFMFSGDYDIYECTPGQSGTAVHIEDVDRKKPGPGGKMKLGEVLSHHKAGGTVFSSALAGQIKKLAARGYNCLVITDGDLLYGDNFTNFRELYASHRKHVWLLLDSRETFSTFIKQMKEVTDNASHL